MRREFATRLEQNPNHPVEGVFSHLFGMIESYEGAKARLDRLTSVLSMSTAPVRCRGVVYGLDHTACLTFGSCMRPHSKLGAAEPST